MKTKTKPKRVRRKTSVKTAALELVRKLPTDSTWDDLRYRIYVRQTIEAALKEAEDGNWISHEEMLKEVKRLKQGRK